MIEFLFFAIHVLVPLLLILWLFWQPHRSKVELALHLFDSIALDLVPRALQFHGDAGRPSLTDDMPGEEASSRYQQARRRQGGP